MHLFEGLREKQIVLPNKTVSFVSCAILNKIQPFLQNVLLFFYTSMKNACLLYEDFRPHKCIDGVKKGNFHCEALYNSYAF